MRAAISVIIPALNEAQRIADAIDSAFTAGAAEVIVSDGGSSDGTAAVAREHRATVITGETMRSRQMNVAAAAASGDALIFLHADTWLPPSGCEVVLDALERASFGGFRIVFAEPSLRLRIAAAMINARTAITRCPWGDQAQFIRRDEFLRDGGFREIPIMEDYELAVRMKERGRSVVLPQKVITSGRRFLEKGLFRTAWINWRIVAAWRRGADPDALARLYRS